MTIRDLDAALAANPPSPEAAVTVTGSDRRCGRHVWVTSSLDWRTRCQRCLIVRDEQRSRRSRNNRSRGNAYELTLARRLGGTKVGHHGGPEDVRAGMFVVQSKVRKAFPNWQWDELAKLPRTDGRIPLLVVANSPGPGHRRRAMVVIGLDDWCDLHGSEGVE